MGFNPPLRCLYGFHLSSIAVGKKLDFFLRRGTNYLQSFVSGGVLYRA